MNFYEHTIIDSDGDKVTIVLSKTYEFPQVLTVRNYTYDQCVSVDLTQQDLDRLALIFKEAARYERKFDDSKVNKN